MIWTVVTVVGPILLILVLAWAIMRNRKARTPNQVTEAGTRRVYEEEEQRRRDGTDDAER
jgi:hypothetical protein